MTHQRQSIDRQPFRSRRAGAFENGRSARCPVDRRHEHQADLVDEGGTEKAAVEVTAAFEEQAVDPQLGIQNFYDLVRVEVGLAGKDIADAVLAQSREMRVRYRLG